LRRTGTSCSQAAAPALVDAEGIAAVTRWRPSLPRPPPVKQRSARTLPSYLPFLTLCVPRLYPKSCSLRHLRPLGVLPRAGSALCRGDSSMFLDVKHLEIHPLDFEEEFHPDVIDLGGEARQLTPAENLWTGGSRRGASRKASCNQRPYDYAVACQPGLNCSVPGASSP